MSSKKEIAIEILAAVLDKIHSPDFKLRAVMETILDYLLEMTEGEIGSVLVKDDAENALRLVAVRGDLRKTRARKRIYPLDRGIQGRVVKTGKAQLVKDVSRDPDYIEFWPGVISEIAVPIIAEERVLGVLNIESSRQVEFEEQDMHILTLFASHAASAISIDKLKDFEEVRRIERELLAKEACFVIMPFSEPFNKYYDAIIAPAVESTGLSPIRADSLYGPANVMEDVWEGINKAKLLIAELTTRNPNVMYELGLAHAMEKAVVLLTQNIEDVPFDLRSIRCIVYDTTDPNWANILRDSIRKHIEAVIQDKRERNRFRPFYSAS